MPQRIFIELGMTEAELSSEAAAEYLGNLNHLLTAVRGDRYQLINGPHFADTAVRNVGVLQLTLSVP